MADPDNFADYDEKTRTQIEGMIEAERRALARRRGQLEDCDCKAGMFPNPGRRGVLFALRALPLHVLFFLSSGVAFFLGTAAHIISWDSSPRRAG